MEKSESSGRDLTSSVDTYDQQWGLSARPHLPTSPNGCFLLPLVVQTGKTDGPQVSDLVSAIEAVEICCVSLD
jgi:hypothetical protein